LTRLAHISDLHLDGSARASARVRLVMDHLRALPEPPDALLVTGDIADRGDASAYREARALLEADFPVLPCPGNHDLRGPLRSELLGLSADDSVDSSADGSASGSADGSPVNYARRIGDVLVLMGDSTQPGRGDGALAPETLAWVDATLRDLDPGVSAVLAFHHPPVPVYHPEPDSFPLRNPGDLAEVVARHPRLVAIVTGHAHTAAASVLAGRPVVLAPAVTWTLVLPPRPDRLDDRDAPPGLAWHTVRDGRVTSHFGTVPVPAAA
jgi:3',5'-cyclic AMP phosphodiesterase CpdA